MTAPGSKLKTQNSKLKTLVCPALADLLEGYRDEVVAAWVKLLYSLEDSHYRERPVTELQHSTGLCLAGLVTLFRHASYDGLLEYSQEICATRAGRTLIHGKEER